MFTLLCAISIQILIVFCKDRRLSFYMSRTLHLFGTDWCAMMVPIQVIRWYRLVRYDGTDSSDTMVPNAVLWWYRFMRYSGTDSPILSIIAIIRPIFKMFHPKAKRATTKATTKNNLHHTLCSAKKSNRENLRAIIPE